ncbi:MAG: SDR family NAD(P)-dependent oxidoreductase [Ilumatobacteraceae bacterium]|nr:SDR family oxidoreductase [Acidimicrobiales bacterium]MCB9394136.1 SDR family oxidoreductase [Acidimicrobiaceae bacterium]
MQAPGGTDTTTERGAHPRVALVTGAAAGIGRAITDRLVADGALVIAGDIDGDGLARLQHDHGDRVITQRCDVTDEASVQALAELATARGGLDAAVANAGKGAYSMIVDHDLGAWQEIVDLCLTGVFLTVKHAGRVMNDGGSIVNIASLNAIQPAEGMAAYCTAKAGVAMFTKVAAMELGRRRIRVNTVAPGLVQTAATGAFFMVPGVVEEFVDNTTVGRFAQPDDIADMVAFLVGPGSTFVSAGFFSVDGGASTRRYPDLPGAFERLAGATGP